MQEVERREAGHDERAHRDDAAFETLAQRCRQERHVRCRRMLATFEDAELMARGVDADPQVMGWKAVPPMLYFLSRMAPDRRARLTTMTSENEELTLGRVSSESVRAATGRGWEEWLEALDTAGAADWDHKEIVAHLEREHPEVSSGWWRQSITVGYEQARGKRAVGQTADAGFQVGVQRTVAATATEVWELITSRPELWLGEGASVDFDKGGRYEVPPGDGAPGASGEVRVVKPGDRLRMTWQPEGWPAPATLQLTLSRSGSGNTAIHAHLEKLPDADAREAMRRRWREALERIVAAAS